MLAEKNKVLLHFEPRPEDPRAAVDKVAMQRTLYNLVTNAIEACAGTDRQGEVTLSVEPGDETFRLIVADNGSGMPPEVREKLFQAFFSTKGSKGTGLGLPVVAKTASEHGGNVDVESEVGVGTRFILTLPWRPPAQPQPEPEPSPDETKHG
jgi:signal transduction histidine kinase